MTSIALTLIGKPGCHLCEDAKDTVTQVMGEYADRADITLEELSILDDSELHDRHWEEIPVLLVDGKQHTYWRVDAARLRAALDAAL
ncbi:MULTISPECIES: glutaredoxin family protein [Mycetocola]|uniref:Glutaredoxin family protein n=1 Tax=Mycetocola lacteus TaxID=76637 RepID=A0A3L7AIM2_9MICO|nr:MULTISPECIES: glutaredoxin family protein [Mycetocola]MCS4276418.1 glutaredoxin [Mycetocola sp. BIGb0189]RLP79272.1 glutaredoxin family protein [Mycetocola lacteus]